MAINAGSPARSVGAATLSQGLSALSNFVIGLALGRAAGEAEVGQFALIVVLFTAGIGLQRALLLDPLMARPVGSTAPSEVEVHRALTTSLAVGFLGSLLCAALGAVTQHDQVLLLALFFPAVLVQDLCRYMAFRQHRHLTAAALDGIWVIASCGAFVILLSHPSVELAVVLWGGGGLASAVTGVLILRARPAGATAARRWWHQELWPSSRWLTLESAFFQCEAQILAFGMIAVAGAARFGEWQVASSLVGLATFINVGVSVVVMTRLAGRPSSSRALAARSSAVQVGSVIAVTVGLVVTSPHVVELFYGSNVSVPVGVLLPTGVTLAVFASASGPIALVRAAHEERVLPSAKAFGTFVTAPLAVLVASRSFEAGLWVLAIGGLGYTLIVGRAAGRLQHPGPTDAPIVAAAVG